MSPSPPPLRVGVLASGSGSNFVALTRALNVDGGPARVCLLVSNVPTAGALARAAELGVDSAVVDHKAYATREAYDAAVVEVLRRAGVQLVCLAGYMRLVTKTFLAAFPDRVLNVHPALLPSFPGLHGARQALEKSVKLTGCTVHVVDEGTDTGPIIAQAAVRVRDDDDESTLQGRIQQEEHRLFPAVVRAWAQGKITVHGRRVRCAEEL